MMSSLHRWLQAGKMRAAQASQTVLLFLKSTPKGEPVYSFHQSVLECVFHPVSLLQTVNFLGNNSRKCLCRWTCYQNSQSLADALIKRWNISGKWQPVRKFSLYSIYLIWTYQHFWKRSVWKWRGLWDTTHFCYKVRFHNRRQIRPYNSVSAARGCANWGPVRTSLAE